jgi:hypothetical protein
MNFPKANWKNLFLLSVFILIILVGVLWDAANEKKEAEEEYMMRRPVSQEYILILKEKGYSDKQIDEIMDMRGTRRPDDEW